MPSNDDKKREAARAGARRLIEQAPQALMGLFAISGVAYLAGSVYTRSYFSEFGASWILEEVPAAIYFSQSWIPLLLILFFGYLATTNLALYEGSGDLTTSTRFKISAVGTQYGAWLLMGLVLMILLLSTLDYVTVAITLSVVSIALMLFLFASALELVVLRFGKAARQLDLSMAYLSFVVIAAGLYVVPAQLGMNWARADKQTSSTLLRLHLRDDGQTEYKLLFAIDERWYVFPTTYVGRYPPVKAIAAGNVSFAPQESRPD